MWSKAKFGTGVYKVTWDKDKLNGLGDISVEQVSVKATTTEHLGFEGRMEGISAQAVALLV